MLRNALLLPGLMVVLAGLASVSSVHGGETPSGTTRNAAPVTVAGNNQVVHVGERVILDAGGSHDPDGDVLSYAWTLGKRPRGSAAKISGSGRRIASFQADVPGSYTLKLTVSDGKRRAEPDLLIVTALSRRSEALLNLVYVFDLLTYTDESSFKRSKGKKLLTGKINAVLEKIEQGSCREALARLRSGLFDKMDGCRGGETGSADRDDWVDCETQAEIYPYLTAAMDALAASGL